VLQQNVLALINQTYSNQIYYREKGQVIHQVFFFVQASRKNDEQTSALKISSFFIEYDNISVALYPVQKQ